MVRICVLLKDLYSRTSNKRPRSVLVHADMSTKPRIFRQVLEACQDYKSVNRNENLVEVSRKFESYKKELRALIMALAEQHTAASEMNKARVKVCPYVFYIFPFISFVISFTTCCLFPFRWHGVFPHFLTRRPSLSS